jgi:hypothetical protein
MGQYIFCEIGVINMSEDSSLESKVSPDNESPPKLFDDSHSWRTRRNQGYFRAFFIQVWEMVQSPTRVYRQIDPESSFLESVTYALQITIFGAVAALFWEYLFFGGENIVAGTISTQNFLWAMVWFFLPLVFVSLVNIFLLSAISHGLLKVFANTEKSYGASVKAYAFSQTAVVANIIPFLGNFVGGIWAIVLAVIGLREQHEVTTSQATLAVLLPFIVFVFIIAVIVALGPQLAGNG